MTNLKEVNFGLNQYCGPAILSVLTGESTDRCAAVISAVSGRLEIKAVSQQHLKEALKRLKFDVEETIFSGGSLYSSLFRMHTHDGFYVVFVPNHVVAVEVRNMEIYICDNHTKTPIDIKQSARLTQKVQLVWKVVPHPLPKLISTEISISQGLYADSQYYNKFHIFRNLNYENKDDNVRENLGSISFKNKAELLQIILSLTEKAYE